MECPFQASCGVVACVAIVARDHDLHGPLAGYLASLVAAHAVGDKVQGTLVPQLFWIGGCDKLDIILIVRSSSTNIGELDSHQIKRLGREWSWQIRRSLILGIW
jgi:hypothetical protein